MSDNILFEYERCISECSYINASAQLNYNSSDEPINFELQLKLAISNAKSERESLNVNLAREYIPLQDNNLNHVLTQNAAFFNCPYLRSYYYDIDQNSNSL
ncbi:9892_t:CDS:2 [Ambispora leptoticha]|uniref:9892_t:CDS:1 n=1 Tax=Ambispora leptoticha TaxID=144679 RepID=A0A9N8V943_9GLOM|nr:9892_t:CDS:2 [Ambispora leptoticha]